MEEDQDTGRETPPKSHPRRRRPALSCITCRRRKLKCDRGLPCGQCVKSKSSDSCQYAGTPSGSASNTRRVGSARPDSPSDPLASGHGGVYVFDSKYKPSSNRIAKPAGRTDELYELRSRLRALEHALSRQGSAVLTPETGGYDSFSDAGRRLGSDSSGLIHEVEYLPSACFRGKKNGTRHCGRSHWAVSISFFKDVGMFLKGFGKSRSENTEYASMKKLKHDGWIQEREEHQRAYRDQAFKMEEMLPSKSTMDELVELYLATFETTYRILHVPTFLKQYAAYRSGSRPVDMVFVAKLLAVMAASSCFYNQKAGLNETNTLQKAASGWIMAVQSWISSVAVSSNANFDMLQIQCLLMFARQANASDGDKIWTSSGSLVREAMVMGLHRDPSRFTKISKFWAEMRRRLWATIMELDVQSALNGGMLPSIDLDECDCDLPSNWEDADLTEDMEEDSSPRSLDTLTRSSMQAMLCKSLPIRIRIARLINGLKFNLTYDEALRLNEELMRFMNDGLGLLQSESSLPISGINNTAFAKSFYLFIMRRALLVLHRPFSLSVLRSPKFSYSRRVCLESSLEILSLFDLPADRSPTGPYPHLGQLTGGMFRDEPFHAATTICVELGMMADEHSRLPSDMKSSDPLADIVQSQQAVMCQAVERTLDMFGSRMSLGGLGCKVFFFLTMVFASVQGRMSGIDPLKNLEYCSTKAMRECMDIRNGVSWAEIRSRDALVSQPLQGNLDAVTGEAGPDPTFDFLGDLSISPIEFGNLFDIPDYGVPELWDNNFLTGL